MAIATERPEPAGDESSSMAVMAASAIVSGTVRKDVVLSDGDTGKTWPLVTNAGFKARRPTVSRSPND